MAGGRKMTWRRQSDKVFVCCCCQDLDSEAYCICWRGFRLLLDEWSPRRRLFKRELACSNWSPSGDFFYGRIFNVRVRLLLLVVGRRVRLDGRYHGGSGMLRQRDLSGATLVVGSRDLLHDGRAWPATAHEVRDEICLTWHHSEPFARRRVSRLIGVDGTGRAADTEKVTCRT